MPATLQPQLATGAGPSLSNAVTGIGFGRDDNQTSLAVVPPPAANGTKYSYFKCLALVVTATAPTTITNRRINWSASPPTGITGFFLNQPTYTQNNGAQGGAAGNYPADNGATNGATPSGYTQLLATPPQLWDNTSASAGATGRNGNYCQVVIGVDFTFTGGSGSASLPGIILSYDEA